MYSTVLPNVDLKILFKPVRKLQCLSQLKSGIPLLSRSKVVYKISCNNCNEFYVGLTTRRLEERISEHIKNDASALYKHAVETGHDIAFSRPEILTSDDIELRLQVKETLMIRDLYAYRSLNNMKSSDDLTLWWYNVFLYTCTFTFLYLHKQPKSVKSCVTFCFCLFCTHFTVVCFII